MNRTLVPLHLLLWLPILVSAAEIPASVPAGSPNSLPASYVELYRQVVSRQSTKNAGKLFETLAVGEANVRLWRRTQEPAYLATARQTFESALSRGKPDLRDFHPLMMFARLALLLQQEGPVSLALDQKVREIAESELRKFIRSADDGDFNIRIAQVLAYACLLHYLDNSPFTDREVAQQRLDRYWSLICQTGDLDEDATNYDSFGMVLLVDLARVIGREQDLKQSAGFRRVFERFRDIMSPTGLIPEYGDSYFSTTACLLDRVYLMEYAARLYDDPSFLYAARKLYLRPGAEFPSVDLWMRAMPLINLATLPSEPRQPGAVSLVTSRMRRGETKPLVDKLILRTGVEPGCAMVMMDLYASGSHAHREKGPSIAYFEAAGVPLFHNMGRHGTLSAITGNIVWATPRGEQFPGCWNREGQWFTMTIPADDLTHDGERFAVAPVMLLRNFQERSRDCKELFFDNLRLVGPLGTRLIDGFETPEQWDARLLRLTKVSLAGGASQGKYCERVLWDPVPSGHIARTLAAPVSGFRKEDYTELKLDVKYLGGRPTMHIRGLGQQVDLGDQLLKSHLRAATAQQRGNDAWGEIAYDAYLTPDTSLTRRLVLTAEGCLLIDDELVPGRSMEGWSAGQLWQMYQLQASGTDWFLSADDGGYPMADGSVAARRMFARFASERPARSGSETVLQSYHCPASNNRKPERFSTAYSCSPVVAGRKERFVLVVVPDDPASGSGAGALAADRVGIQIEPGGPAVASIRSNDGHRLEVRVAETSWSVTRQP